ncbi:MAG TPA: hypothetical protein VER79_03125, partial [Candidatus Limnocylindrales bacterium]|nr:hypothetical protein [Candidatus Limnocylindrales bacterium]
HIVGTPTAGLTTANEVIPINEDFDLALTAGFVVDRAGRVIHGPIQPDGETDDTVTSRELARRG